MKNFECIVVGTGAMGSAIAYHIAKRGTKVLALEKFNLNHTHGSSHGRTRIIRTLYSAHPSYVPLVKRAVGLWSELEKEYGQSLIKMIGGLMLGAIESELVSGCMTSAKKHNLPYKLLEASEIREKFPTIRPGENYVAVFDSNAGALFPERCIEAHAKLAEQSGAEIHFKEPVLKWKAEGYDKIILETTSESYSASKIIFAAGPWIKELLSDLNLPLQSERQTVFWFKPYRDMTRFDSDSMPVFMWEQDDGSIFYGLPNFNGEGVKVARHHQGEISEPDSIRREVTQEDEQPVREFLGKHIPWANGPLLSSTTCIYTNTPDSHFILDFHPKHPNVLIVSPCSGHGFKFSPVIGEIAADLMLEGRTDFDTTLFGIKRFSLS